MNHPARSSGADIVADDELFDIAETTAYLKGTTRDSLAQMRIRGDGPPFVKISARQVRYRKSDLDRWIASRVRTSTSGE